MASYRDSEHHRARQCLWREFESTLIRIVRLNELLCGSARVHTVSPTGTVWPHSQAPVARSRARPGVPIALDSPCHGWHSHPERRSNTASANCSTCANTSGAPIVSVYMYRAACGSRVSPSTHANDRIGSHPHRRAWSETRGRYAHVTRQHMPTQPTHLPTQSKPKERRRNS